MKKRVSIAIALACVIVCAVILVSKEGQYGHGDSLERWSSPLVERDLKEIQQDTLRLLVIDHPLSYTRLRGGETGLEFELVKRMAKRLKVPVRAVLVQHPDSLLPMLQRGDGDLIAAQLGQHNAYGEFIATTLPYRHVSPVFVSLRADRVLGIKAAKSVTDDPHSGPDTAWVAAGSPFAPPYRRFPGNDAGADPKARTLFTDTSSHGDDPVIEVALGRMRAALVTDAEAVYFAERFPQLRFDVVPGDRMSLVFGLRTNSRRLREAMDEILTEPDEREAMSMLMSVYGTRIPDRGPLGGVPRTVSDPGTISPYDNLFQQGGEELRWDWELLAAIAFKESRFDSSAVSNAGAQGIMQMMPRTAAHMGVDSLHLVDSQIKAAAIYLSNLDTIWMRSIPNADERLRFVLAAYNAGPGHVLDAQRLATELGLDPRVWNGNVERTITLLALPRYFSMDIMECGPCKGSQTFVYVREVVALYQRFRTASKG